MSKLDKKMCKIAKNGIKKKMIPDLFAEVRAPDICAGSASGFRQAKICSVTLWKSKTNREVIPA